MFLSIVSHCNIKLFRTASLKHASSSGLGRKLPLSHIPTCSATGIPGDSRSCSWQWLQQLCARPCTTSSHRALLKTPASHLLIWLTGNVFCRWRRASDKHHTLQDQNLSTALQACFRFPLGTEKCTWMPSRTWVQIKSDLSVLAEQHSVHCMDLLRPSRMQGGRQKTNTLSKQITPLRLLLLSKEKLKEPPVCEPVLVIFLMASLQSARKRPCQENSSTHTSASLQWTRAKWNIWWEGFKTYVVKEGNGQKSSQLSALSIIKAIRPG